MSKSRQDDNAAIYRDYSTNIVVKDALRPASIFVRKPKPAAPFTGVICEEPTILKMHRTSQPRTYGAAGHPLLVRQQGRL